MPFESAVHIILLTMSKGVGRETGQGFATEPNSDLRLLTSIIRRCLMLEVYVKDGCPYCEKQIEVLKRNKIEFALYNVSVDPEALKKAREVYNADKVPVVVEDGVVKNIGFGGGG